MSRAEKKPHVKSMVLQHQGQCPAPPPLRLPVHEVMLFHANGCDGGGDRCHTYPSNCP